MYVVLRLCEICSITELRNLATVLKQVVTSDRYDVISSKAMFTGGMLTLDRIFFNIVV